MNYVRLSWITSLVPVLLGSIALLVGCSDDDAQTCNDGTDCPSATQGSGGSGAGMATTGTSVGGNTGGAGTGGQGGYSIAPVTTGLAAAPGLEGYGTDTAAGRGGRVLVITNLDDAGPGSAREALEATGPRQIISNVAGEVRLSSPITITAEASFYGQASPGAGLTFAMDNNTASFAGAIVIRDTSDILVQHMRVRGVGEGVYRNLIVLHSDDVVIDHSSFSWSTDQNLNSWGVCNRLTFSNNMTYEGLGLDQGVSKPTLFGFTGSSGLSFHHNAIAHGLGRMPQIANVDEYSVEWNVVHNPGNWATAIRTQEDGSAVVRGNVANNWYQRLQNTNPIGHEVQLGGSAGPIEAFVDGNYLINVMAIVPESASSTNYTLLPMRYPAPSITNGSTVEALPAALLTHVGASLPSRDANDERIVNEITGNSGQIINDIQGNGGTSQTYVPPAATDGNGLIDVNSIDGVPDAWKTAHDIAPGTDLTKQDSNGDGYTDWEDWRVDVFGG